VDPYQAWLAQMPREFVRKRMAEIKQQLEDLPRELEFLQKLDALPVPGPGQAQRSVPQETPARETPRPPVAARQAGSDTERPRRRRKLSQERQAILEAVRRLRPDAGPADVARETGQELAAVQKTMSRMARAGQLVRAGYSRYDVPADDVPPHDTGTTLLDTSSANGTEEAIAP